MVDIQGLKDIIEDSGMTMTAIARKSGISRVTLYNRLAGIGEFTASEIQGISDTLHMCGEARERIFFGDLVE